MRVRLFAVAITAIMMISGLGILSVGMNTVEPIGENDSWEIIE